MFLSIVISSFLLLSIPLFSGMVVSVFFSWDLSLERFKKVFFTGMAFYVIAQLILIIIKFFYKVNYDNISLFIYFWVTEIFIVLLVIMAGYILLLKKGLFRQDSYREFPFVFSYASGYFALFGLTKIINSLFKFDSYILFIYPIVCIILLLLFSIIIIEAGTRRGYISKLIYSLILPISLVVCLIPWFYYLSYYIAAIVTAFVALSCTVAVFYMLKKDYVRN
jgi:hypothetical protein